MIAFSNDLPTFPQPPTLIELQQRRAELQKEIDQVEAEIMEAETREADLKRGLQEELRAEFARMSKQVAEAVEKGGITSLEEMEAASVEERERFMTKLREYAEVCVRSSRRSMERKSSG